VLLLEKVISESLRLDFFAGDVRLEEDRERSALFAFSMSGST
jgi:hypothetical protein